MKILQSLRNFGQVDGVSSSHGLRLYPTVLRYWLRAAHRKHGLSTNVRVDSEGLQLGLVSYALNNRSG